MPDLERDGAEQSGETVTKPGEGTRDEGQAFDGGRESRRMREFPGLKTGDPAEKGDVG
jgi:hypothetical protein